MNNNDPTQLEVERVARDWSKIAEDQVDVSYTRGVFFAFGTEVAMLRLHYAFKRGAVSRSSNVKTWLFSLEAIQDRQR